MRDKIFMYAELKKNYFMISHFQVWDRVNVKNERNLQRIERIFHTVTTTDDPVIRKLVKNEEKANVFVTDAILSTLMCASRSVYSWDIVVQKIGGKVFLDKRDNSQFGEWRTLCIV